MIALTLDEYIGTLTEQQLLDITEAAAGKILSLAFGCMMTAEVVHDSKGKVHIDVWGVRSGSGSQFALRPNDIPQQTIKLIAKEVRRQLGRQLSRDEYRMAKAEMGRNVTGEIISIAPDHTINVLIAENFLKGWHATYPLREQPLHERHTYRVGQQLEFHVNRCLVLDQNSMRIEVTLSRRAKKFVAQLLWRILYDRDEMLSGQTNKIKCVDRIPGAYSLITVTSPVSQEAIRLVTAKLGSKEKVFVTLNGTRCRAVDAIRSRKGKK